MAPVELVWAVDRLELYRQLESENRDDTFSLRGLLWHILQNRFPGHVYVDDFPRITHVCCLHTIDVYEPTADGDMTVMCTKDLDTFTTFFYEISKLRSWDRRRVIMCYVEEQIVNFAEETWRKSNKSPPKIWKSAPLRHYTLFGRQHYESFAERARSKALKITPGLSIEQLRLDEASLVAEYWPYEGIPYKESMFRWLIRILPSSCVRDPSGRPVAWAITWHFGPGGAAYVLPEFRGKNLVDAKTTRLSIEALKNSPTRIFFWIVDDNVASQRQIERTNSTDLRRTDMFVHWMSYEPGGVGGSGEAIKAKL